MEYNKPTKHVAYSDECGGKLTVHVDTSRSTPADYHECSPKAPVKVWITQGRKKVWSPGHPLCLGPMHDPYTREGRRHAAEDAVAFFEHDRCGRGGTYGLGRASRARKRRSR